MFVNFIDNNEHYRLKSVWSLNGKVMITRNEITGFLVHRNLSDLWDRLLGSLVLFTFQKAKEAIMIWNNYRFSSITAQIQCKNKIASTSSYAVLFLHKVTKCLFTWYHNLTRAAIRVIRVGLVSFDICLVFTNLVLFCSKSYPV